MQNKEISNTAANQYPHQINYLSRFVRSVLSFAPQLHLVAAPERPQGISVMMRVKDERDWIAPSIKSIKHIADEIVVVDNGSKDGSYEIVQDLAGEENGLIKYWQRADLNHCDLSNFAQEQTSFRWIFRWDGDMVAHTSGTYNIRNLRNHILSLSAQRYYLIYLRHINVSGDLSHQDPEEQFHIEEYIHTFSSKACYVHPKRFEAIMVPKYYKVLFWYEPYSFHVNVKPARRMLRRYFWADWMELKDFVKFPMLDDYVRTRIKSTFGTTSWEEAEKRCVQEVLINHIPYRKEIFGPYPELLKPYLENPKYKMIYENGKIIGRDEP
jgi:glycosyltransferase involved in cell wall biosynthesis